MGKHLCSWSKTMKLYWVWQIGLVLLNSARDVVTVVQLNKLVVSKSIIEQILHCVALHYTTSFIPAVCFYLSIFFCHYKKLVWIFCVYQYDKCVFFISQQTADTAHTLTMFQVWLCAFRGVQPTSSASMFRVIMNKHVIRYSQDVSIYAHRRTHHHLQETNDDCTSLDPQRYTLLLYTN